MLDLDAVGPIRTIKVTPSEDSWTLGIERQLPKNILVDVEYIGKKGNNLYFGGDNQLDILPTGGRELLAGSDRRSCRPTWTTPSWVTLQIQTATCLRITVQQFQLELPYPQFTSVTADYNPAASSIYNALQITAQKNFSNGLQFLVTYVWSKSIDDSSAPDDNTSWLGGIISLQDPNKPYLERSLSSFDVPQTFQASYVYALPFGRGRRFMSNSIASRRRLVRRLGNERRMAYLQEGRPLAPTTSRRNVAADLWRSAAQPHRNSKTQPRARLDRQLLHQPGVFVLPPSIRLATLRGPSAPFAPPTSSTSICR